MAEFFHMGGYAGYIWPAIGVTVLVMAGLLVQSVADLRTQRRLLGGLEATDGPRPRPSGPNRSGATLKERL